jgi:hypothetical protein
VQHEAGDLDLTEASAAAPAAYPLALSNAIGIPVVLLPALHALDGAADARALCGAVAVETLRTLDIERLLAATVRGRAVNYDARLVAQLSTEEAIARGWADADAGVERASRLAQDCRYALIAIVVDSRLDAPLPALEREEDSPSPLVALTACVVESSAAVAAAAVSAAAAAAASAGDGWDDVLTDPSALLPPHTSQTQSPDTTEEQPTSAACPCRCHAAARGGEGSAGTFDWGGYFNTQYFADPKEQILGVFMKQTQGGDDNTGWKFRQLVGQTIDD